MAKKEKGWICLHRSLTEHCLWKDKPFSKGQAWIDLLLLANHENKKFLLGNEMVEVEAGSFITSEVKLMQRWGWSRKKVHSFLEMIEKENMIVKNANNKRTAITIVKWEDFQNQGTAKEQQKSSRGTSKEHQKNTNNNNNNNNNYNNVNNIASYQKKVNKFNQFPQNTYDFEELEKRLMRN